MTVIILDLETTVASVDGNKDNSPFNPKNRSYQPTGALQGEEIGKPSGQSYHKEHPECDDPTIESGSCCSRCVGGTRAKFDVMYR